MQDETNPYASPTTVHEPDAAATDKDFAACGNLIFARRGAPFPDRCVKCNAPAEGYRVWRHLTWHSPWAYFWLLFALIAYFLVAMATRREITIKFGLCNTHRIERLRYLLLWWAIIISGSALSGVCFAYFGVGLGLGCLGTTVAGIIITGRFANVVRPVHISDEGVKLAGCGAEFIHSLDMHGPNDSGS